MSRDQPEVIDTTKGVRRDAVALVGYGMGGSEMVFLLGLGVIYAVAYRLSAMCSCCGRY